MMKFIYLFIALILAACGTQNSANISSENSKVSISKAKATVQSVLTEMGKGKYVQGQLLVKFKSGTGKTSSIKANKTVGATVIRKFSFSPNLQLVQLPTGMAVENAIAQYMSDPDVEYAEPNYIRSVAGITPNDTYFHNQYALENTGQYAYGTSGADIKATDAWRVSKGNYGIAIAVLDTGIDYSHNDLVSNMWRNDTECYHGTNSYDDDGNGFVDDCAGWSFVSCLQFDEVGTCVTPSAGSNDPFDDYGHGTHVAGIIGAVGNNGTGISGVMWNSLLMPVKVCNADGQCADADIANGLEYAMNMGAKAVNASFGGYGESITLFNAFEDAVERGVLVVASAGNETNNNDLYPAYPASYAFDNIISVAATDQDDNRVAFSNFGIRSVDVAAPGVYIFSTVPTWWSNYQGYGYLEYFDGTSMAAPHVTGLAGLLYSYYYNFTSDQIRNMVLYYVDIRQSLDGWVATRGRINAWNAMSSLWEPYDLTLNAVSPTQVDLSWTDIATDELNCLIDRKQEGGAYSLLATLGKNTGSYTDSSIASDGTKYSYRVRLKNWIGESPGHPDNERTITIPVSPPTGLTAAALSASQVTVNWVDNSNSEEGFRIFRRVDNEATYVQIGQVAANVSTYHDSGLFPSVKYVYQVQAYNSVAGNSSFSNEATVTTPASGGSSHGGGGGGCSIGAKQNMPTALADIALLLVPFMAVAIMRRRR